MRRRSKRRDGVAKSQLLLWSSREVEGPLIPLPRDPGKSSEYVFMQPVRENANPTAYFRRPIHRYINRPASSIRLRYEQILHPPCSLHSPDNLHTIITITGDHGKWDLRYTQKPTRFVFTYFFWQYLVLLPVFTNNIWSYFIMYGPP